MGALLGTEINLDDPFFGTTDDDPTIARQLAVVALGTPLGSLDAFPEYGFQLRSQILRAMDATEIAMLPLEMRAALEQEPAFTSAEVTVQTSSAGMPKLDAAAQCVITVAEGASVGFTLPM